jgi:hypothetical protein
LADMILEGKTEEQGDGKKIDVYVTAAAACVP